MNACKAIEKALKDSLVKYAAIGQDVWLCCEQEQVKDSDPEEKRKAEKVFPQVWMMATPEGADDNGWTFHQPLGIVIATHFADDPYAVMRAEIYEAVGGLVKKLYVQALDPSIAHTELDYFTAQFTTYLNGGTISIGGITMPGGSPPGLAGTAQTMSVELVFHWSQKP